MAPRFPTEVGSMQVDSRGHNVNGLQLRSSVAQHSWQPVARAAGIGQTVVASPPEAPAGQAVSSVSKVRSPGLQPSQVGPSAPPHKQSQQPASAPLFMRILELAEKLCLCTSSQRSMMLDYVRSGRFTEAYYTDMWSRRLQDHSMEAAALLRDVLAGGAAGSPAPVGVKEEQAAPARIPQPNPMDPPRIEAQCHELAADRDALKRRFIQAEQVKVPDERHGTAARAMPRPGLVQPQPGPIKFQSPGAASVQGPQLRPHQPERIEGQHTRAQDSTPQEVKVPDEGRGKAAMAVPRPRLVQPQPGLIKFQCQGAASVRGPQLRPQRVDVQHKRPRDSNPEEARPMHVQDEHRDEWSDAPCELMRRATRTFEPQDDKVEARACPLEVEARAKPKGPVEEELVELSDPDTSLPAPFQLPRSLHDRLRPYQRAGVAWMAGLSHGGKGGILADEMGLGKTVQTCAFLHGIRQAGARHALILVPVTLLEQWANEAWEWCSNWPVYVYHGSAAQRAKALTSVMRPAGGVLLTSYSIIKRGGSKGNLLQVSLAESTWVKGVKRRRLDPAEDASTGKGGRRGLDSGFPQLISTESGEQKPWDIVICDEAHTLRNISTLVGKRLRKVQARCRILLTGTPVQNALQDLWALMDFAQPGLLGNHETFTKHFSEPIDQGSVRGASAFAVGLKKHLCEQLWRLMQPHMLRRTKASVGLLKDSDPADAAAALGAQGPGADERLLQPKTETVVWLMPTEEQVSAYKKVLETSELVRQANAKAKAGLEVFRAIALLKRLCNHPVMGLPMSLPGAWQYLLTEASSTAGHRKEACAPIHDNGHVRKAGGEPEQQEDGDEEDGGAGHDVEAFLQTLPRSVEALLSQSSKLKCLSEMLPALISRGHRVLVFSQGVKMMDLVELCILKRQGIPFLRIDGKTDVHTRADRVRVFQEEPEKYNCMLLTTGVGGYGLNLTGADRVVLLDPAWNPATDMQAVDRAFRIGQEREVRVYRFVTSGLMEDKMFRLQVFKMGLTKTAMEAKQQQRYFTTSEIRGLFQWTDPARGETHKLLLDSYGQEQDEPVRRGAQADGSEEGWLTAGPVIGLSNFSMLYTIAEQEGGEVDQASSAKVAELKSQLDIADKEVRRAGESRHGAENQLKAAQQAMDDAAQQMSSAAEAKSDAAELLKQKQAGLAEAKRQEAAAEKRSERALRAQASARVRKLNAERSRLELDQAATLAGRAVEDAKQASSAASEDVRKSFAAAEGVVSWVGDDGKAAAGGRVSAEGTKSRAARKALASAQKAVDAALAAQEALELAEEAVLKTGEASREAERLCKQRCGAEADPKDSASKKAEAAAKACEKEHAKANRAHEKAQERAEHARECATKAVAALADAGAEFADSLHSSPDKAASAVQVKSAQSAAKAALRQLGATWQVARTLQEAWAKASSARGRAAEKALAAAAALEAAGGRLAAANQEATAAEAAARERRRERVSLEEVAAEAGVARAEAAAREAEHKRKRSEFRAAVGKAKAALKPAKAAQKQATAKRTSLVRGGAARGEPDSAKSTASEAISAIRALQEEAYDANQVEEAYQAKKKQRCSLSQSS